MRTGKLADLASGDTVRATRALLYLTYEDPDCRWLEGLLLDQVREGNEPQLRLLAVTCMGHLGRMRGAVGAEVVACLERLLGEPELGESPRTLWGTSDGSPRWRPASEGAP